MSRVATDSVVVTVLNTVAQLAGFALFAAITGIFGANASTDAFFLAYTVPMLFVGPVGTAIRTVLLPVLAEFRASRPDALSRFVGAALGHGSALAIGACLILAAATPLALPLLSPSLTPDIRHLVVTLTLYLLPLILAQTVSAVLASVLNVEGRFILPVVASGSRHLVALGLIVLLHRALGIVCLPLAFVVAAGYQVALLLAGCRAAGFRMSLNLGTTDEIRRPARLALPLVLGSSALYLTVLVTRFMASHLEPGSVTILDYAARIWSAVMEALTSGVLLVVLASWSHAIQGGGVDALRARLSRTLVFVLFVALPVFSILFALREPVVTVLLGHGQFTPDRVARTSAVLGVYIFAFPMDVVGRIYIRFFIARQSTWVIAVAAAARLVVVGALAYALLHPFGLSGLAVADGIGLTVVAALLVLVADAHVGRTLRGAWWPVTRSMGLAIIGGWVAHLVAAGVAGAGALAQLAAGSAAGAMAFLASAWIIRAEELHGLAGRLWPRPGER